MNIGEKIKALRTKLNLTQEELADAAGTTKQTIHKYETGIISNIPASKVKAMADKLYTTPAYLMGWEPDNDPNIFNSLTNFSSRSQIFGKRLRELRDAKGLSMDSMVEKYNSKYDAKMNKSTLSRYENELQIPIYTVVVNLADFFGVSIDYLLGRTNNSAPMHIAGWNSKENSIESDLKAALMIQNLDNAVRELNSNTYIIHGSEGKGTAVTSDIPKDKYLLVGEGNISELTKKEYGALKSVLDAMSFSSDEE